MEVDKFCSLKKLDGIIFTAQAPLSGYLFSRLIIPTKWGLCYFYFFRAKPSCELHLSGFQCGKFEIVVTLVANKI